MTSVIFEAFRKHIPLWVSFCFFAYVQQKQVICIRFPNLLTQLECTVVLGATVHRMLSFDAHIVIGIVLGVVDILDWLHIVFLEVY